MTPEEQRIKIAELCGWTRNGDLSCSIFPWINPADRFNYKSVPDYPNCLNACRQMEATLSEEEQQPYFNKLHSLVLHDFLADTEEFPVKCLEFLVVRAAPGRRCQAFLKVKGFDP